MPRRPFTAQQKAEISQRMKARWKAATARPVLHLGQPENGVVHVDTRIVLHVADQEFVLCELNESRTDVQRSRWNRLAAKLSEIWKAKI